MPQNLLELIAPKDGFAGGSVTLEGSKSISNRVLIIRALSHSNFQIENLSPSNDSATLADLLESDSLTRDAGAAGTTFRFLTAFLACNKEVDEILLTGSERMKQRPILILVNALRKLGAEIQYGDKEGYPPLRIKGKQLTGGALSISASVSSQYISALLMIGPGLEKGLQLTLEGKVGSRPYIEMTLRIMQHFGVSWSWEKNVISINEGLYSADNFHVEGDWSAASYYYGLVALAEEGTALQVNGLGKNSLQGDAVLDQIYEQLGVGTTFNEKGILLVKQGKPVSFFEFDFSDCPDLAQTVVVSCAALGVPLRINGLESLRIKETDRTAALQTELAVFGVKFEEKKNGYWELSGRAENPAGKALIHTYEDHRMAMCFAPLALKFGNIVFEDPNVVKKSYPSFWTDWELLGFTTTRL